MTASPLSVGSLVGRPLDWETMVAVSDIETGTLVLPELLDLFQLFVLLSDKLSSYTDMSACSCRQKQQSQKT